MKNFRKFETWLETGGGAQVVRQFSRESHIYELDPSFASLIPTHPLKWKSLEVLSFSPFHLKKLSRLVKGQGKIDLEYNNRLNYWTAARGDGTDVTNHLDKEMAEGLRDRLSSLPAVGWNLNVSKAYQLLETPDTYIFDHH